MSEVKIDIKPTPKPLITELPPLPKEQNISLQLLERKHNPKDYRTNPNPGRSPFDKKKREIQTDRVLNKKKQKPQRNFFTQQIEQHGENFIDEMKPYEISNNCDRIISELARGKCNIAQVGSYIANPKILTPLIIHCGEQFNINEVLRNSLDFTSRAATLQHKEIPPLQVKLGEEHRCKALIYATCLNKLQELKQQGNPEILASLVMELKPYSNYLRR